MIGTDFTMIQRLFVNRNRDEIKRKFKREEKLNQALIDKILAKTSQIDLSVFVQTSSDDETEISSAKEQQESAESTNDKHAVKSATTTSSKADKKKYNRNKLKRIEKSKH